MELRDMVYLRVEKCFLPLLYFINPGGFLWTTSEKKG